MRLHGSGNCLLGVDITSSAVRLVELRRLADGIQLESFAVCPIAEGAVVERRIHNPEDVVRALSEAVRQAGPVANRAVIALPSSAIISKVIELPLTLDDDEEIEALISLQSDQHIPFPFHDVAFDFQRLGVNARDAERQDVLLVACRNQDISQLQDIVTRAGLVAAVVDAEPFVIERVLAALCQQLVSLLGPHDGVAVVDVGSSTSFFHVFYEGRIAYSRHMTVGMAAPDNLLPENLAQDTRGFYQPEPVSFRLGDAVADAIDGALGVDNYRSEAFCDTLATQIERAQQLYCTTHSQPEVSRILLAGDATLLAGLEKRLARLCPGDVMIVNPFSGMTIGANVSSQRLQVHAPELLMACGLAMRAHP
ncbi:MAG: type IV pilus biogenesis protein PilM [Halomonas sp.]|uniref:type IV pilus biogenesis protein PilM n=1 Tax=Halomonas sp. TaxID=1486246 RepID=UPI003F8DEB0D